MSLMRRIAWLLVLMLTLALGGALLVSGGALRELLAQQASIKNADNAQALALAASQQGGDAALIELLMSAQFDTGHYQMLRWTRADGRVAFERQAAQQGGRHPAWLPRWVPIQAEPGLAQLSSGWQQLGKVELASQLSYAYDALWTSLLRVAAWAAVLALAALLAAWALLQRIRRPLDDLARQAHALADGQFLQVQPSGVRELQPLTRALNGMVARIEQLFAAHTEQLGLLRQQAHCDALTGLYLRQHFQAELASALARHPRFPGLLAMFARLGEQTGELPQMLQRAAQQLAGEVQRRALQLATLLEPALIVGMGLAVMLIVLAVLLPIIQLNQLLR